MICAHIKTLLQGRFEAESLHRTFPKVLVKGATDNSTAETSENFVVVEKDENLFCPAKTLEKPRNRRKNLKPVSSAPMLRPIRAVDRWRVVQQVPTIPC